NPPFLVFFSFYQYGAHRDLPSFPTRRSSDLEVVINPVANVAGIADDRAGYTFEVFRYFGLFDKGPLEQVIIRSIGKIFHLFARQFYQVFLQLFGGGNAQIGLLHGHNFRIITVLPKIAFQGADIVLGLIYYGFNSRILWRDAEVKRIKCIEQNQLLMSQLVQGGSDALPKYPIGHRRKGVIKFSLRQPVDRKHQGRREGVEVLPILLEWQQALPLSKKRLFPFLNVRTFSFSHVFRPSIGIIYINYRTVFGKGFSK